MWQEAFLCELNLKNQADIPRHAGATNWRQRSFCSPREAESVVFRLHSATWKYFKQKRGKTKCCSRWLPHSIRCSSNEPAGLQIKAMETRNCWPVESVWTEISTKKEQQPPYAAGGQMSFKNTNGIFRVSKRGPICARQTALFTSFRKLAPCGIKAPCHGGRTLR